jgi:hypothetical protein
MGEYEAAKTIARELVDGAGEAALDVVKKKIEEAEDYRDGERVTKWLMVREAVQELLRSRASDGDPPEWER